MLLAGLAGAIASGSVAQVLLRIFAVVAGVLLVIVWFVRLVFKLGSDVEPGDAV